MILLLSYARYSVLHFRNKRGEIERTYTSHVYPVVSYYVKEVVQHVTCLERFAASQSVALVDTAKNEVRFYPHPHPKVSGSAKC